MNIDINGISYFIKNKMNEPTHIFSDRCLYICKKKPLTHEEFLKIERYSNIWSNIKYLKCTYDEELQKKL
jgi:hypothetical protein